MARSQNVTFVSMPHPNDGLSADRFRILIEQLRDELGGEWGWKSRIADRLGLSHPYINLLATGQRRASSTTIDKAIQRLGIEPRFFFDPDLGERPDYRDHLVQRGAQRLADPPHWREFLEKYEHVGAFSEQDLDALKNFAGRQFQVRSWTDFERIAEVVRNAKPSPTFEKAKAQKRRR